MVIGWFLPEALVDACVCLLSGLRVFPLRFAGKIFRRWAFFFLKKNYLTLSSHFPFLSSSFNFTSSVFFSFWIGLNNILNLTIELYFYFLIYLFILIFKFLTFLVVGAIVLKHKGRFLIIGFWPDFSFILV